MEKNWENLSDEELIVCFRNGQTQVADFILDKYKGLVRKKARLLFMEGGDQEDLLQEGMLGLFKAVREYDPERAASFFTFAELCITRQMLSAIEAASRKKHLPLNASVSIEDLDETQVSGAFGTADGPETIFVEKEAAEQLLTDINEKLSPMERRVLDLYLSGLDYLQIAKVMQKPGKAIDNALQRVRSKVRKR